MIPIGSLRVFWIPQVPMTAFEKDVKTIGEAKLLLETLAEYDTFQFEHNVKPDYCNAGGLLRYETDDGSGKPGWCDWYDEEGNDIDSTPLV